jgi:hypothetical protein
MASESNRGDRCAWDNGSKIIFTWQQLVRKEVLAMDPKSDAPKSGEQPLAEPIQHITGAHQLLTSLSEKFGAIHPELNEAITKLELALSALTVNTGGMF